MKRTTMIVLATIAALSMTACDGLDKILQTNVFESFAAVSAKEIENATPDELIVLSGSDSFYEELAGTENEAAKEAVLVKIEAALVDPKTPPETKQELAVLAANVELQTTPAGELITNLAKSLEELSTGGEPEMGELIGSILPAELLGSDDKLDPAKEDDFIAMINALDAADAYYQTLGAQIGTDGYAAGADISAGDVAQSALVAAMVGAIAPPPSVSTGDYLYTLLTDPNATPTEYTMPATDSGYLFNILAAANMADMFGDTTTP